MAGVIVHPVGGLGEWVTSPVSSLIELTHLDSDVTVPGVLTQRAGDVIVTIVTSQVVFVLCWWLRTTLAVGVAAFFLFRLVILEVEYFGVPLQICLAFGYANRCDGNIHS